MNKNETRFFVLTGGPGSGKSAVIEALHGAGYARAVEAGRSIIQDQLAIGGNGLPWKDPIHFAELMLSWDIRSYHIAEQSIGTVFFDRGVVDVIGYLRLLGLPVPKHMEDAATRFRYNRRVFIASPWEEIYQQDRERTQDFVEAVRTYEAMIAAYSEYGYELVKLPKITVEERMHFIIQRVSS